jgi:hypothetical protein
LQGRPTAPGQDAADEVAQLAEEYGIDVVRADNFSGATSASMLTRRSLGFVVEKKNCWIPRLT